MGLGTIVVGYVETGMPMTKEELERIVDILRKVGAHNLQVNLMLVEFELPAQDNYQFMERIKDLLKGKAFSLAATEFVETGEGYFYDTEEEAEIIEDRIDEFLEDEYREVFKCITEKARQSV